MSEPSISSQGFKPPKKASPIWWLAHAVWASDPHCIATGSIHFWKKHNSCTPKTLLYGSSKKVYPPKVDAPLQHSCLLPSSRNFFHKNWSLLLELSQRLSIKLKSFLIALTSLFMLMENAFFHYYIHENCFFDNFEYLRY